METCPESGLASQRLICWEGCLGPEGSPRPVPGRGPLHWFLPFSFRLGNERTKRLQIEFSGYNEAFEARGAPLCSWPPQHHHMASGNQSKARAHGQGCGGRGEPGVAARVGVGSRRGAGRGGRFPLGNPGPEPQSRDVQVGATPSSVSPPVSGDSRGSWPGRCSRLPRTLWAAGPGQA